MLPSAKKGVGGWHFKEEENNSQGDRKSKCLVKNICYSLGKSLKTKVPLVRIAFLVQSPYLNLGGQ